jgi:hypothetical protein
MPVQTGIQVSFLVQVQKSPGFRLEFILSAAEGPE